MSLRLFICGNSNVTTISNDLRDSQKIAQEKLIRSKLYKGLALAFAIGAFVVMVYFHRTFAYGDPMKIVKNPILIAILLLPFLPSWFLAILSKKRRAEAYKVMEPHMQTIQAMRKKAKEQDGE